MRKLIEYVDVINGNITPRVDNIPLYMISDSLEESYAVYNYDILYKILQGNYFTYKDFCIELIETTINNDINNSSIGLLVCNIYEQLSNVKNSMEYLLQLFCNDTPDRLYNMLKKRNQYRRRDPPVFYAASGLSYIEPYTCKLGFLYDIIIVSHGSRLTDLSYWKIDPIDIYGTIYTSVQEIVNLYANKRILICACNYSKIKLECHSNLIDYIPYGEQVSEFVCPYMEKGDI